MLPLFSPKFRRDASKLQKIVLDFFGIYGIIKKNKTKGDHKNENHKTYPNALCTGESHHP